MAEITIAEWDAVFDIVEKAADAMLGEVVLSKRRDRIGVHAVGTDEKALELSMPDMVDMYRAGRLDDLVRYVHVTCALMEGVPNPPDGKVMRLGDGLFYVWRDGKWQRMFA